MEASGGQAAAHGWPGLGRDSFHVHFHLPASGCRPHAAQRPLGYRDDGIVGVE